MIRFLRLKLIETKRNKPFAYYHIVSLRNILIFILFTASYTSGYNNGNTAGYNRGVTEADNRVNVNSVNYQNGYNAGVEVGKSMGNLKYDEFNNVVVNLSWSGNTLELPKMTSCSISELFPFIHIWEGIVSNNNEGKISIVLTTDPRYCSCGNSYKNGKIIAIGYDIKDESYLQKFGFTSNGFTIITDRSNDRIEYSQSDNLYISSKRIDIIKHSPTIFNYVKIWYI